MTMLWEKVVVTAKEFLQEKNINTVNDFTEPYYQSRLKEFDWELKFCGASVFCEMVWKIAIGKESRTSSRQLDRLFSPSPVSTHANFMGCQSYKTGIKPEKGALVIWKRGNSWQGHMAIVTEVSEDFKSFDVIDGRVLAGSKDVSNIIIVEERKGKKIGLPFSRDQLNILGFVYVPDREIA